MKNANKTIYCPSVFLKSSPVFLFSSSHAGNLPTTTCLSFSSSFHPPTTVAASWHCSETLSTWPLQYRASQLSSPFSKSFSGCCKEISVWGRIMRIYLAISLLVQRMQTYRKVTNYNYSLQMPLAHSRLLPEVIWQILRQLCKPPST